MSGNSNSNSASLTGFIAGAITLLVAWAAAYLTIAAAPIPRIPENHARAGVLLYPLYALNPPGALFVAEKITPWNYSFHPQIQPYTRTRAYIAWTPAFLAGGATLWFLGISGTPRTSRDGRFLRGRRLFRGAEARRKFAREMKNACRRDGEGLRVIDAAAFSLEHECRHGFAIGGTGSGKTAYLQRLIEAARARGDRLLVHDVKADFTEKLPGPFLLLAPHDRRSAVWDIAIDVQSEADAIELAGFLIQEGKDPFWSQAAQALFIGWTLSLMRERGRDWGWPELAEMSEKTRDELKSVMEKHYPSALTYVAEDNAMTASVLASLKAPLQFVRQLGQAWPRDDGRPLFNFREWLTTDVENRRLVIFQSAPNFTKLSASWINAAVQIAASIALSPALPDNPRNAPLEMQRRIWFVLDELPALRKLPSVESVIALGRSKGLRVFAATQTWEQLTEIYGINTADAWMSMTAVLIALYSKGKSATKLSEIFGDAEFEVIRKSQTQSSDKRISSNYSPQLEKRRVLLATDFEKLGKTKISTGEDGIVGYALINGDAFEIEYSFLPENRYRPALMPAAWTYELSKKEGA